MRPAAIMTILLLTAFPAHAGQLQDDAECRHNHAIWGMGSFRSVAHSACRLELTARRVVDFHARLVTGG